MIGLELTRPWLLLTLVVTLPLLWYYFYHSLSDFPRRQRIVSLVVRSCLVTLIVLALAGLTLLHSTKEKFIIFAVDQSTSVGENAAKAAEEFLKTAATSIGKNKIVFMPFAASTGPVQNEPIEFGEHPSILGPVNKPKDVPAAATAREAAPANGVEQPESQATIRDGTNLATAIETAAGYLPPGYVPQIVLLTDGVETAGDALAAATHGGVPISTFPLP